MRGIRPRSKGSASYALGADEARLLEALSHTQREQPAVLSRRFGILNLHWVAVEELGGGRGPRALDGLLAAGLVRRHARHPEVGRITAAGARALAAAVPAA